MVWRFCSTNAIWHYFPGLSSLWWTYGVIAMIFLFRPHGIGCGRGNRKSLRVGRPLANALAVLIIVFEIATVLSY